MKNYLFSFMVIFSAHLTICLSHLQAECPPLHVFDEAVRGDVTKYTSIAGTETLRHASDTIGQMALKKCKELGRQKKKDLIKECINYCAVEQCYPNYAPKGPNCGDPECTPVNILISTGYSCYSKGHVNVTCTCNKSAKVCIDNAGTTYCQPDVIYDEAVSAPALEFNTVEEGTDEPME